MKKILFIVAIPLTFLGMRVLNHSRDENKNIFKKGQFKKKKCPCSRAQKEEHDKE